MSRCKLNELKVTSFTTSLKNQKQERIVAGDGLGLTTFASDASPCSGTPLCRTETSTSVSITGG